MANKDRLIPLSATIALHLLLLAVLAFSFHGKVMPLESGTQNQDTPIVTKMVGTDAVQKEIEALRKEEAKRKADEQAEKQRLAHEAQKAKEAREAEEKRIQELKKQAAEQEVQRRKQEEDERKKILAESERLKHEREQEQKKLAEIKKQQEDHRKQLEQKKQEDAKKAEAEKQKAAEQAREKQKSADEKKRLDQAAREKAERDLEQKMAAEQARIKGEQSRARAGMIDAWKSAIQDKVRRNWGRPIGSPPDFKCRVEVIQSPTGEVQAVHMLSSCGNPALDNSVTAAVWKASPLPKAPDPAVFDRELELEFIP